LLIPASLALAFLFLGRLQYPQPRDLEIQIPQLKTKGLPRTFWMYVLPSSLIAAGYMDFPIMAFHFQKATIAPERWIPIFYAFAMATDGLAAMILGKLFDRVGLWTLVVSTLLSTFFAPLVLLGNFSAALVGVCLWGIGLGAQESILRAVIAGLVPTGNRASAYGVFDTVYGLSWFVGSALMGILYDVSFPTLIIFSVVMQLAAVVFLIRLIRMGLESR
jgi:predicted MFS family arabinose efflux permease